MTEDLTVAALDERYGRLRIVQPAAERAVRASLERLGQLMPIVVCERAGVFAVVDGFKRVSAARVLGMGTLRARVMPLGGDTAAIAALVSLNAHSGGLTDLEEAMIVRALCRDEGLEQVAVAELLGRHKSWVSRRLSLAERLSDIVADDVRAGLCATTVARELARLPRGNQPDVAAAIRRHALGSREAARLVTLFAKTSAGVQQSYLLEHPREALEAKGPHRPMPEHDPRLGPLTQAIRHRLFGVMRAMSDVAARLSDCTPARWTATERAVLAPLLARAKASTDLLLQQLTGAVAATDTSDAA